VSSFGLNLQKAGLRVVAGEARTSKLTFSYNPSEMTTSKSATWNRPTTNAADDATEPQFAGVQPQAVQMEIFFDAYEDLFGDVSDDVKTLFEWTKPTSTSAKKRQHNPPILSFEWGSNKVLADFRGYLETVSAKYTMFRADGTPIRATASITLKEIPVDKPRQNPTSGSLNSRRSHVLRDGDSLQSVAYREYGYPAMWRSLAVFNGIDDPLRLIAGSSILIPSAGEAARLVDRSGDG
jgi:Contractile injection system tube protein